MGAIPSLASLNNTIHDAVLNDIRHKNVGLKSDVFITNLPPVGWRKGTTGFLDLYCEATGEIWELKKASLPAFLAIKQLDRYLGGTVAENGKGGLILGRYIEGSFSYLNYDIIYYSVQAGVIVYETTDMNTGIPVPIPSKHAERNMRTNREKRVHYRGEDIPALTINEEVLGTLGTIIAGVAIGVIIGAAVGNPIGGALKGLGFAF